jgi:hypothetical protein
VGLNLISSNLLDGNGVKAMPGSIPAPNRGYLKKFEKIMLAKLSTTTKNIKDFF